MGNRFLRQVGHLFLFCGLLMGCGSNQEPARGQLMVALSTDMSIPKDVSRIHIEIVTEDHRDYTFDYDIAPDGKFYLPGTLAVVAGKKPGERVEVTAVGIRGSGADAEARTLAKAVTTIPRSRIARLPLPIQWLCSGSVVALGDTGYASTCQPQDGEEQACRAGQCAPVEVNEADLPDFVQDASASSTQNSTTLTSDSCFDTVPCLDAGEDVVPDADCTFLAKDDGRSLNVGLRLPPGGDGICNDADPAADCYIPLDRDDSTGWSEAPDANRPGERTVTLPPAVCDQLKDGNFDAVRVTGVCPTKTAALATCGPWSQAQTPIEPTGTGPIVVDATGGAGASGGEGGMAGGEGGAPNGGEGNASAGAPTGGADSMGGAMGGSPSAGSDEGGSADLGGTGGTGGTAAVTNCDTGPLLFADPKLEGLIRTVTGVAVGTLRPSDVTGIGTLDAAGSEISSLDGIECLKNLSSLDLSSNSISDLSKLSSLTALATLQLKANQISDVGPLATLPNLSSLDLSDNQISDLTALVGNAGIGSGDTLGALGNPLDCAAQASNIGSLVGRGVALVTNCNRPTNCDTGPLTFVDANLEAAVRAAVAVPTRDLMPADVAGLTQLDASGKSVVSLAGVECLKALTTLKLGSNTVVDLTPLTPLTALSNLQLPNNQITDLTPLTNNAGLSAGDSLDLKGNPFDCFQQGDNLAKLKTAGVTLSTDCGYQPTDCVNGPLTFVDLTLEKAVRNAAGVLTGPLLPADVTNVTSINWNYSTISSLEGIECLKALTTLTLVGDSLSNVSRLSGLTSLTSLNLSSNAVTDLSPLSGLTALTNLTLSANGITSISALSGLTGLRSLDLGTNSISDLAPLGGLTALNGLTLDFNVITTLSPLASLGSLSSLSVSYNEITSLSPLTTLTGLVILNLSNNFGCNDLSPLSGLSSLQDLYADGNGISDLTPLAGLPNLFYLYVSSNSISDITPLSAPNLFGLDISYNNVSSLSALSGKSTLNQLWASGNQITDISPIVNDLGLATAYLSGNPLDCPTQIPNIATLNYRGVSVLSDCNYQLPDCSNGPFSFVDPNLETLVRSAAGVPSDPLTLSDITKITSLDSDGTPTIHDLRGMECLTELVTLALDGNAIEDLLPLKNLTKLTDLDLGSNNIDDASVLANLTSLTDLDLGANNVADVSALATLPKLTWLYLGENQISDLTSLKQLTRLKSLYLSQNGITTLSPLSSLKGLTILDLRSNSVSDLSPLKGLTKLRTLDLQNNSITTLSDLVNSPGIGAGDYVNVNGNPISAYCASEDDNVTTLQGRGVTLFAPCP